MPRGVNLRTWSPVGRRRALWGSLALVLVTASLIAFLQATRVRSRLIGEITDSTSTLVHTALGAELTSEDTLAPATGARYVELSTVVRGQLLADGTVDAVTVWSPGGTILYADDVRLVGEEVRSMRTTILAVIGDAARSDVARGIVRTFVPLEVGGGAAVAVELDRSFDPVGAASDPWRLLGLVAGVGAVLCFILVVRTFTRSGRRAEGFDEDALRAAVVARRRAEHDRTAAEERRDELEAELERTREGLREAQARARDDAKAAADAPRLREHLAATAEDLRRSEEQVTALATQLSQIEVAVEARTERDSGELAAALAEIARLQEERATVADRAARAEEAVARLTARVSELQARPDIEAELESAHREAEEARQALEAERSRTELVDRRTREIEREALDLQRRLQELERRPNLSAKMDAAGEALDIAREQIRALTARADEAEAEAASLRAGTDGGSSVPSASLDETEAALAATRAELETALSELRASRAENEALHREVDALEREADAAGELLAAERSELGQALERMKVLGARAADADAIREQLEAARAELAELRAERETADDGPSEPVQPRLRSIPAETEDRPLVGTDPSPTQVDALVRQVITEAWSDRERIVSIYAEPVTVEAEPGQIESILDALLERSLERTSSGNRLVVHVERANDGALLSVEDGRPATEDALSPEARRLAVTGGGWADVENHPGGGAVFRVWVPPVAPASEPAPPVHREAG